MTESAAGVVTARLQLVLWDAATVAAIRAGERLPGWHEEFPREDDRGAASLWHDGDPWGPRSIVSLKQRLVIGSIGFFGPPSPAADEVPEVEVGYGLVAPARGYGLATEALGALLERADAAGVRVRASISPDNAASLRVVAKAGFTGLRGANEDGEMVLVRPLR
ncbi:MULTISPECIES: GNAT family N-acetyltransferase [unclassified Nocardioides]|jgi:ribosomal-protein-alanine N-acetyltransferase|uniref:GNAT family N-acetyltransferase n=1 Tax=unclassified Nocardioides TaxID=2615069 RepID=UPI0007039505|nr:MULTISPECIES: GNAT family N-acetyltransferase [unclassified Nocardioides]KRC53989.1 GCN5 family acetyltransferase [Nocardioides sp. Root79]KRC71325.1 GCN5 family acetyltransferase [Nocardioides sp. Root240]